MTSPRNYALVLVLLATLTGAQAADQRPAKTSLALPKEFLLNEEGGAYIATTQQLGQYAKVSAPVPEELNPGVVDFAISKLSPAASDAGNARMTPHLDAEPPYVSLAITDQNGAKIGEIRREYRVGLDYARREAKATMTFTTAEGKAFESSAFVRAKDFDVPRLVQVKSNRYLLGADRAQVDDRLLLLSRIFKQHADDAYLAGEASSGAGQSGASAPAGTYRGSRSATEDPTQSGPASGRSEGTRASKAGPGSR
jgi:hypothetical protein